MRFVLALALVGCGSVNSNGPDGLVDPGEDPALDPAAPSELSIDSPAAASYLAPGSATVTGKAVNLESVALNGAAATLGTGTWQGTTALAHGLNTFEVTGQGADGVARRALRSALAGSFVAPDGEVPGALNVHVGAPMLQGLAPLASGLLVPADLTAAVLPSNPIVDDGTMVVNVVEVQFDAPVVAITPADGALDVTITLPNFQIPLLVETQVLFFGVEVDAALTTQDLVIQTQVLLGTDGAGGLTLDLTQPTTTINGFELVVDGLAGAFAGDMISQADAQAMLQGELDTLLADLPTLTDGLLADLDLGLETELMGLTVALEPKFAVARVQADGIRLGLDVALDVNGAAVSGPGHLMVGAPNPVSGDAITLQISDDFMNRALHELWAGGALNLELPIEAGGLESALLAMFGGQPGVAGALSISSALPPVMIEKNGQSRLQLGEVTLAVDVPGGEYGDRVELLMAIDAKAELELTGASAGVKLSQAEILLVPVGASANVEDLVERVPELQTAMGIGIGMLNDLLAFPLVEEGAEPLALPELAFVRDAGGKSTTLALSADDLGVLAALLSAEPTSPADPTDPVDPADPTDTSDPTDPTPPADPADPTDPADPADPADPNLTPGVMSVAIPGGATVHSSDADVSTDGATGWVCRNDDVTVLGAGGTWYVDEDGGLVVEGDGNTIYAADDAQVVLLGTGNTVYADPGATVEDDAGTNLVIEADELTFDLTSAPDPGC